MACATGVGSPSTNTAVVLVHARPAIALTELTITSRCSRQSASAVRRIFERPGPCGSIEAKPAYLRMRSAPP